MWRLDRSVMPTTRLGVVCLLAVVLGAFGTIVGVFLDGQRAALSYLAAYEAVLSTVLGMLLLLMTITFTGGDWFEACRRDAERVVGTLPVLGLLFIPIVAGASRLYPWVGSPNGEMREVIAMKWPYLTSGFAVARAVIYWTIWIAVGETVRRASVRRERTPTPEAIHRMRVVSAAGIILVGLTSTFAAVDWIVARAPNFDSSIFGLYYYGGATVSALALAALVLGLRYGTGTGGSPAPDTLYSLGNLLIAFVLLWIYLAYSQFLIIWVADLPMEVGWFAIRARGGWRLLGIGLVVGHFVLPFLALLLPIVKRSAAGMIGVAAWLLSMHVLDLYWLVVPGQSPPGFAFIWLDLAAFLFVSGLTLLAALRSRTPGLDPIAASPSYTA